MLSWSDKYIFLPEEWWYKLRGLFQRKKCYYLYVATNQTKTVLFTGITTSLSKLEERWQKTQDYMGDLPGTKYLCMKLVYWEQFNDINKALKRKKEVEKWKHVNIS